MLKRARGPAENSVDTPERNEVVSWQKCVCVCTCACVCLYVCVCVSVSVSVSVCVHVLSNSFHLYMHTGGC